jgi:hypothetical protein
MSVTRLCKRVDRKCPFSFERGVGLMRESLQKVLQNRLVLSVSDNGRRFSTGGNALKGAWGSV